MAEQTDIDAQALDWVIRTGDDGFDDWPAFQAWLEADARHSERYHAMSADLAELAALVPAAPVVPLRTARRRWPLWSGGAIAASIALVVGYGALKSHADPYAVETVAGAMRTVRLADGSIITLGGATRVLFDRGDARVATLERGEAMFVVRHDADHPFAVDVGDRRLVDVGTAFDLKRTRNEIRVAVSEGAIDFDPGHDVVRLIAGQALVARDGEAAGQPVATSVGAVGAWRQGTLAYDHAGLADVADDLSRTLGVDLRADPTTLNRRFSGTITVAALGGDPSRVAPLLDVAVRRAGDHWVMTAQP